MKRTLTWFGIVASALAALIAAGSLGCFLFWNGAAMGGSVSGWVSGSLAGAGGPHRQAFTIASIRYPWLPAVRSFFLGGTCPFVAEDVGIWDPDGHEVIRAERATGRIAVGEVAWPQILHLAIPGYPQHTEVHLSDVHVEHARAVIGTAASGKVNIVAAFQGRKPGPSDPRNGIHLTADRVTLDDVEYTMDFPGWRAELNRAAILLPALSYSSFASEQEPERPAFTFRVDRVAAPRGRLLLGGAYDFPLAGFVASRFASESPAREDLGFDANVVVRGAPARATGRLESAFGDHPGVDCTIAFEQGAGLAALLPGDGMIAGNLTGEVRFHGPFSHVLIDGRASHGEFRVAGLVAREVAARFALDRSRLAIDGIDAALGAGHMGGRVDIDLAALDWKARLTAEGVDISRLQPLVPAGTGKVLGGSLDGSARAGGSFTVHPERITVSEIDARLSRRARDRLPRTVQVRGGVGVAPDRVRLENLVIEGAGLSAQLRGEVSPLRKTIRSEVTLGGHGLGALLERFGLPPVASTLSARASVSGPLLEPVIDGSARATHVGLGDRRIPEVGAHIHLEHGTLAATRLYGEGFGGTIDGALSIGLFDGPFTRRRLDPTVHVDVGARRLRVHALLDLPAIRGEISGHFGVDGTLDHPTGTASLELPALTIWGDPYHGGVFTASLDPSGLLVDRISLERDGGGRFSGKGRVGWDGALDVDVVPRDFPLQAIPPLRDSPVALGGMLSGLVHLGGALGKWIPGGVIEATSIRVREFLFGDGRIDLKPEGTLVRVAGVFFSRFKSRVDGWITLTPAVAGDLTLSFEELPLDELIPEMKRLVEVKSVASGTARIRFDLAKNSADVELRLAHLAVNFTGTLDDEEGAEDGVTEQFVNPPGEDLVLRWDGHNFQFDNFHLLDIRPAKKQTVGDLRVTGRLGPEGCDASIKGRIELRFLEFLAVRLFEHTHGEAVADLRVIGPLARPHVLGTLDLDHAELVPRGADRAFKVPGGQLRFSEGMITLTQLRARLDDAEATAEGTLALSPDWTPGAVRVDVKGQISATPLSWFFPDHISETQGHFDVALQVRGSFPTPTWEGSVVAKDIAFREKRLARDVRIVGGSVALHGWDVIVGCPAISAAAPAPPADCRQVVARLDDSSELNVDGRLGFRGATVFDPRLRAISMHVSGENLEAGSSGVFSLQLSPDLYLTGDGSQLRLAGNMNLVSGRYYQNFEILDLLRNVIRPRTDEHDEPFYAGIPLLENMELDVNASSSGALFIRDNLADLHVSLPSLDVSGTVGHPILDGTVFVEAGGRFTIPLLRGEFVSDAGSITFEAEKEFPHSTPRLDIRASTDWQDRYDQIHHINLTVTGTYQEPYLDLTSTDGWDKNQVLAAMVTGGTPDQLRRAATEPGRGSTTSNPTATGITMSITGQLLLPAVDPLKQAFGLDLVRIELGYDSVLIKLCPVNKPTYRLCGTGDVGFVSTTHYDARAELKLTDHLSVGGVLERIEHGVDTTEDVINRAKLQLSLRYPLF